MRVRVNMSSVVGSLIFGAVLSVQAVDRYVAWDNAADAATPFTSWATAATNIQDAVDVAADGDVIWVAPGTYSVPTDPGVYEGVTNVVHITKGIELRSSSGVPADTIIDGDESYRGMYLLPPNARRILVDGFTVRNCVAINGAGIYIHPENTRTVVVQNCIVEYNTATNTGGGISIITDNNRSLVYMISNCVIRGNQALTGPGGGIADGGTRAVRDAIITDCLIVSNRSHHHGGGIYLYPTATTLSLIKNSVIAHNETTGTGRGAGLYHAYGNTIVRNCLLHENTSVQRGGGIYSINSLDRHLVVQNCTIASNSGPEGSGISCDLTSPSSLTVVNTIVHNDTVRNNGAQSYTNCALDPSVTHATGAHIIFTNDPGLVDPDNGNYRLAPGSICINAGTNQSWMAGAVDLDGNPRVDRGVVDIGAYEYVTYGTAIMVR